MKGKQIILVVTEAPNVVVLCNLKKLGIDVENSKIFFVSFFLLLNKPQTKIYRYCGNELPDKIYIDRSYPISDNFVRYDEDASEARRIKADKLPIIKMFDTHDVLTEDVYCNIENVIGFINTLRFILNSYELETPVSIRVEKKGKCPTIISYKNIKIDNTTQDICISM